MNEKSLLDLSVGEEGEIVDLQGGRGFRARLRALGLAEGQIVRKISRVGWGGPIVVLINRAQIAIGRGMARKIIVRTNHGFKG
ncbi:ferrous iron transport protein A [candidate division WOR-3 bacterium]|nr:ferrous iron transport protein A [candidate division WOR-3 bacterium]